MPAGIGFELARYPKKDVLLEKLNRKGNESRKADTHGTCHTKEPWVKIGKSTARFISKISGSCINCILG
jgi:hypothetical protein